MGGVGKHIHVSYIIEKSFHVMFHFGCGMQNLCIPCRHIKGHNVNRAAELFFLSFSLAFFCLSKPLKWRSHKIHMHFFNKSLSSILRTRPCRQYQFSIFFPFSFYYYYWFAVCSSFFMFFTLLNSSPLAYNSIIDKAKTR